MSFSSSRAAAVDTSWAVGRCISRGDDLAPESSAGATGVTWPVEVFLSRVSLSVEWIWKDCTHPGPANNSSD